DQDFWVRSLEALEHVGQHIRADREGRRDLQRGAAGRPEIVDGLAGQRDGVQELLGMRSKGPPGGRQREPALAADEQGHAERLLEGPDAGADGRLGHSQRVGGPAEAAERPHREKGLHLTDFHSFTSLMAMRCVIRTDYSPCERSFRSRKFIGPIKTLSLRARAVAGTVSARYSDAG